MAYKFKPVEIDEEKTRTEYRKVITTSFTTINKPKKTLLHYDWRTKENIGTSKKFSLYL